MDKVTFLTHLPEILHRILPRLINHALDFLIYCNFGSKKTAGDPARIFDLLIDYVGPLFLGKKARQSANLPFVPPDETDHKCCSLAWRRRMQRRQKRCRRMTRGIGIAPAFADCFPQ